MKKRTQIKFIVLTGPESTGKTQLAGKLRKAFSFPLVPEYARPFIASLDRPYELSDLEAIAEKQLQLEKEFSAAYKTVLCDTDLLTIIIWAQRKFNQCPEWIMEEWQNQNNRGYLLCMTDVPWEKDDQRENPLDRDELFDLHKRLLIDNNKEYHVIYGLDQTRFANAAKAVRSLLK